MDKKGQIDTARGFLLGLAGLIIIGIMIVIVVNSLVGGSSTSYYGYNQTWLEFDGDGDYVLLESNITDTVTFWYANATSYWFFVANSTGTLYLDGVEDTPAEYPVYYNGTHYFIGMHNDSSYFEGLIDDFRLYEEELNITQIEDIYNNGR